jgi:uncharacterized alkaline shock family protein YloU
VTATLQRPDAPPGPAADLPGPDARGTTTIADRVVERIAARAAGEVDQASGAPRRILGRSLGRDDDADRRASADARVDGRIVTLAITLAVQWPANVREVAEQVRRHVAERVRELTGLEVAEVDVDVPTLLSGARPAPRVR